MPTVKDIHTALQRLAPDALAESWDNVGILAGSPQQEVHRILVALDPDKALIEEATSRHCDLIITHHPIIFKPLRAIDLGTPTGAFLAAVLRAEISVIACHTSLDSVGNGVSSTLAQGLGLNEISPLVPTDHGDSEVCGLGSIGHYQQPIPADELVRRLCRLCAPEWILAAGHKPEHVSRVAVCGGSGSDLATVALARNAEVYITAELKHSVARWAEESGIWLLDAGHFCTENPAMPLFAERIRQLFAGRDWTIPVDVATQASPLKLLRPVKDR